MSNLIEYENNYFEIYKNHNDIVNKITLISKEINEFYKGIDVNIIGLLDGCLPTLNIFKKKINFSPKIDLIKVSSYKDMKRGNLFIENKLNKKLAIGENILLIDDIVDSGNTINRMKSEIIKYSPNSNIKIFSLLVKEDKVDLCDWYCYLVPDKYVIGFGMDINNLFRELNDIYIMKD